jgi:transcriptional regulator GlxA family with amidase domain
MSRRPTPRRIGLLAFDGLTALDLVGPSEVFATANSLHAERAPGARPPYELLVLGVDHATARAESGLVVRPDCPLADAPPLDTLLVPGGCGLREPARLRTVARWLRRRQRGLRRIASVCTGAYALAEAGLLDGRRAATHWRHAAAFAARYPAVRVDADAIYVREDRIYTSAGITAGIDLALALVEEDLGPDITLAIARELVVYLRRAGGQRQYSERLALSIAATHPLAGVLAWIQDHLHEDLPVERLAAACHLGSRQLTRRFGTTFGTTPAACVERLRVEEGAQLLLGSARGIEAIARAVGFRSPDVFRRAFERRYGIPPQTFRARFGATDQESTR